MTPRQITVLGECVADAFTEPANTANELALRVLPGGGPANTAVALARLGTPARLLARLSGDVFGRMFRSSPWRAWSRWSTRSSRRRP
ncbi:PfkB family carbohydrate kinase, partial [Streptomyces populi]